jgi:putative membrane protein (TIGR04086 family)
VRRADSTGPGFKRYVMKVLIGSLIALLVCLVLLFPASALVLAGVFDESLSGVIIIVVTLIGSFIGGMFSAKRVGERTLFVGITEGILLILWFGVIGILFFESFIPSENGLGLLLATVAGGVLGAMAASSGRSSRTKRSRK